MADTAPGMPIKTEATVFNIIMAISFCHLLNDTMQSLIPALYPMIKQSYALDFAEIGLLGLVFQVTASLLQPLIGIYTDKRPLPYSLAAGMSSTLIGLLLLAYAHSYWMLLVGAGVVGLGSAIFHPESSRVARLASGGRHGLAQSLFQVGGNFGSAIGPLLAAFIVLPNGQTSVAWFCVIALVGIAVLWRVGNWYAENRRANAKRPPASPLVALPRAVVIKAICVLALLVFSKYVYMASISSYYTFYMIERFAVSVQQAQILLFVFLGAVAVGTVAGGPIVDWFGTKFVIWFSILGTLPFTLALPYVGFYPTVVLTFIIGVILASAFSAIVVFAQELVPGRVGMIAGLFFGFAFGIGGIAAAILGVVADHYGIEFVYRLCSYLPLIGLMTVFLPDIGKGRRHLART
ncbi:MFS transporter [Rhizobium halophytocola]|uniref:FSR family fosmidomycin resistance protein-like MFS transporter n=1 Tax=Rhizobium halophytocola TaxID=735519 RepID=A0ABS4E4S3_9HYPH|nr:MFS transporter [Rhizobium halophytocola]MBP1852939.1 FSR family fosmidomycin resistance protein-like MFS transporter [Rhizobium halophytocola]